MNSFAGKAALVTGGTSGIGRAIALAMRERRCHVTVASLGGRDLEAARSSDKFAGIHLMECDVTSEADLVKLFRGLDSLDFVIQCAGVIRRLDEYDPDVFSQVVDVNLTASFRVAMHAKPLLARQGGCIVNTASVLSTFGGALVPGYSASKGGIVQLTKSLAVAWAKEGIRVNAVAPGWITTNLTQTLQDNPVRSRQILERTPMGRWGTPEDLVEPYLFLCSPGAAFITGITLLVDGGYSIS